MHQKAARGIYQKATRRQPEGDQKGYTYKHGPGSLEALQEAHVGMQQLQGLLGGGRPADPWQPGLLGVEPQLGHRL